MRKGYLESSDEDLYLAEFDLEAGNEVMEWRGMCFREEGIYG